jgi:hypothetical protein
VSISQTNYISLNEVMAELHITPDALEIPCPRFFLEERSKELEQREKLLVTSDLFSFSHECRML